MPVKQSTSLALIAALKRLMAGQAIHCDGSLTMSNLAIEAGVARASLYRCSEVMTKFREAKAGRGPGAADGTVAAASISSSEKELRDAVKKLANRVLLMQAAIRERDKEIAVLQQQISRSNSTPHRESPFDTIDRVKHLTSVDLPPGSAEMDGQECT